MHTLQRFATASVILLGIVGFAGSAMAAAPYIVQGPGPIVVNDTAVNSYEHQLHREIAWQDSQRSHAFDVASLTPAGSAMPTGSVEGSEFGLVDFSIFPQQEQTVQGTG